MPVTLSDPAAAASNFLAPVAAEDGEVLVFELFVTDAEGLQSSAKTIVCLNGN
jgi:hypothetical protein